MTDTSAIAAARMRTAHIDTLSDRDLVAAYQRTDGEPGTAEADALLAEIERRQLDV